MKTPALLILALLCALPAAGNDAVPTLEQNTSTDAAFRLFWQAETPEEDATAIQAILDSGASFDEAWQRLAAGRPYSSDVKTGRVDLMNRTPDRVRHFYRVLVPKSYDPSRKYPVKFYLHGGVARPAWRKGGEWWSNYTRFEDPDWISVFPSSWESSMWWQRRQADNLAGILDRLKSTYNVDENNVHLIGVSDGATGVYFFAFRAPTPWASFLPFIGHPAVLANQSLGVDGTMYARNLLDQPFFIVNGGRDRLYPAERVLPYVDLFQRAGAEVEFRPHPEAGHDTSWWPVETANIAAFVESHHRDPLPDRLSWETETTDRYQRNRWLLITELGKAAGEATLADLNSLGPPYETLAAFPHRQASGRVELVRRDNVIQVRTQGVRRFTLLLSPEAIDFDRPLQVDTNGKASWEGRPERDLRTLLEWAARDNDRTMLFGAELAIAVE